MSEMKYLYGASVHGIQGFIFQTNELREIIGASELVRNVCAELFENIALGKERYKEKDKILGAAGSIKYVFHDRTSCEGLVRIFPKLVMQYAPGITMSQAVVEFTESQTFSEVVDELERKLRMQRNKPAKSVTLGMMGILRARKTGLPVVERVGGDYMDASTIKKRREVNNQRLCADVFGRTLNPELLALNMEDMCDKNNWVAMVHIDGNGMGRVVQRVGSDSSRFKAFSMALDDATKVAAQAAFRAITPEAGWRGSIPIRPIVIGGDDLTVVCRGDLALGYAQAFLASFEEVTESMMRRLGISNDIPKLTACAGVAFMKSSYPFYYGYSLAEALCGEAKADAKQPGRMVNGVAPSCLMFHKIQDSFVTEFKEIKERELTPRRGWSYCYGPYYLHNQAGRMTIEDLLAYTERLGSTEGNAVKSHLRGWMSCLSCRGEDAAGQLLARFVQMNPSYGAFVGKLTGNGREKCIPVYDVLAVCSIINKVTK